MLRRYHAEQAAKIAASGKNYLFQLFILIASHAGYV